MAPTSLVDVRNLGHKRVIRVGVCQQRADGQQHLRVCEEKGSQDVTGRRCEGPQAPVVQCRGARAPGAASSCSRRRTLEMVSAGLHCSFRMSRQMLPWLLMLGWYTCAGGHGVTGWLLTRARQAWQGGRQMGWQQELGWAAGCSGLPVALLSHFSPWGD